MSLKNNLLIAASGTGGHIFPALSVSKNVEEYWNIHWLGIKRRLDEEFVPQKYSLSLLNIRTPKNNIFIILQYFEILLSTFRIMRICKIKNISLVFTTGGYISAPTIIAARLLKIPVIIHESNLIPGIVTKHFGFLCNYVCIGFTETKSYLKNCNTIYTGTPLREEFYKSNNLPEWVPEGKGPLLLVMGGSQGAKAINKIIYDSLEFLSKKKFRVVHITGQKNLVDFQLINSKNYVHKEFTHEVAALIQNCDLVISRSGAGTINELIHTKKPSILIPYPFSKNNHQEKNAMILAEIGGAVLMNQYKISKDFFEETLERVFNLKLQNGNYKFKVLDIMKRNMENISDIKSKNEIVKLINYFLKEF